MSLANAAASLPRGSVTFVMTDIEGSTRLFRELGDSYVEVLSAHNELLREAFTRHGGVELGTEGDSLFVAFEDPVAAVVASAEAQIALSQHDWPPGVVVKVRIGIHLGEAEPVGGDYVSLVVHQVARISSGAHGGQILVSDDVARAVGGLLPDGARLRPLGAFQLRGFPEPQELYQLDHPDLEARFPPLRAIGVVEHNLPFIRTSFVGRTEERAALARLLPTTGVLSIVGPGGVGKTRLAVQVAFDLMGEFEDGAWLVELVPVRDSASLVRAVSAVMGVAEEPGLDMQQTLVAALSNKEAMLILDNCEHIIDETASLAETLARSCPNLTILATSREPLDIEGEMVWRVEPLSVNGSGEGRADAVQLFAERAVLARSGFDLTRETEPQVEEIVRHLNGIPLAIELAAAALSDRPLEGVVSGLSDRFAMLTRGRRTAPDRHQTLQAALEWSLDLLDPMERRLYQRMAVFAGTGTTEAAVQVCGSAPVDPTQVPALIGHLTRASLLGSDPNLPGRWSMLESLRQLALLELARTGERDEIEERHRSWFLGLVDEESAGIGRKEQAKAMRALEADRSNILQAIENAVAADDAEVALRLSSAMAPFWTSHGDWAEGVMWLRRSLGLDPENRALCATGEVALGRLLLLSGDLTGASEAFAVALDHATDGGNDVARARALSGAGYVSFRRSDLGEAEARWAESLELAEQVGEERVTAEVLRSYAIAVATKGDQTKAGELLERAMDAARRAGDDQLLRLLLGSWAELNLWLGRYRVATNAYGDALSLATEIGDISARPLLLAELGWMALLSGDPAKAGELALEAVEFAEDLHSLRVLSHARRLRGEALLRTGDYEGASETLDGALEVAEELDAPAEVAGVLCSRGLMSLHLLDDDAARKHVDRAIGLGGMGHTMRQVMPQWILGLLDLRSGDLGAAERSFEEVLATAENGQLARHIASATWGLAELALARGVGSAATRRHLDGLKRRIAIGDRLGIVDSLVGLAGALGEPGWELANAAVSVRAEAGAVATPLEAGWLINLGVVKQSGDPVDIEAVEELAERLVEEGD